jgi:hypothetical protein
VFDVAEWHEADQDLVSFPVLSEFRSFDTIEEMESFVSDNEELKELKSCSTQSGKPSELSALLTIKKLYSKLFDRVSEVIANDHGEIATLTLRTSRKQSFFHYSLIGLAIWVFAVLILNLFINLELVSENKKGILTGAFSFLLLSYIALAHLQINIHKELYDRIRLCRKLIAY